MQRPETRLGKLHLWLHARDFLEEKVARGRRETDASQTRGDCSSPFTTVYDRGLIDHDRIIDQGGIDEILIEQLSHTADLSTLQPHPPAIDDRVNTT